MTIVIRIDGGPQTGKSTAALGMLKILHDCGEGVAFVQPYEDMARDWQRRTDIPCVGVDGLVERTIGCTAVAADNCEHMSFEGRQQVVAVWERLRIRRFPTQLVLVNWPGEFPPKQKEQP